MLQLLPIQDLTILRLAPLHYWAFGKSASVRPILFGVERKFFEIVREKVGNLWPGL